MITKAIVTGGVRGIGLAITRELVRRDITVIATTHRTGVTLPEELGGVAVDVIDLSSPTGITNLLDRHGDASILVNNSGHMNGFSLDDYSRAEMEHILSLNLITPVQLMWQLGKKMAARGTGRIVNNTSIAAHIGHPDIWYGASKAGLLNATKSVARSLGPKGVLVNAVAAGPTETEMLKVIPDERKAMMRSASILGRFASPEEVAKAVVWLALDSPEYINGICVDINNGTYMR